jgi:hypothetical protein
LYPRNIERILAASFVIEDTKSSKPLLELPHLNVIIARNEIVGSPFALSMNSWIMLANEASHRIKNDEDREKFQRSSAQASIPESIVARALASLKRFKFIEQNDFVPFAKSFLNEHFSKEDRPYLAGKNVGTFDYQFLPEDLRKCFHHRVLDPGMLYIDWNAEQSKAIPGLDDILSRESCDELIGEHHDPYFDALAVIAVLRRSYRV